MSVTAPPARLVVEGLTVAMTGSGAAVIEDVSVEVAAGEVLGVVGESGSGKTTLGLAMVGHARWGLKIAAGSVRLDGTDLLSLPPAQLRKLRGAEIAYVPQDPSTAINPSLRVGGLLKEILTAHGRPSPEADTRLEEVLSEVGLDSRHGILSAYPHQLSGGQQQRVAIAMAFACRPRLIVLDEPTTGLDVTTQRTVLETVARMCASYGVAAVYVSHDVVVVGELSHRIAVVYSGRVVETGATADVLGAPAHPYTQGLLRAVPSPERSGRLIGMEGVPPRPGQRPAGCTYRWRDRSRARFQGPMSYCGRSLRDICHPRRSRPISSSPGRTSASRSRSTCVPSDGCLRISGLLTVRRRNAGLLQALGPIRERPTGACFRSA